MSQNLNNLYFKRWEHLPGEAARARKRRMGNMVLL